MSYERASIPEPAPVAGGEVVYGHHIWRLRRIACLHPDAEVREGAWEALRLAAARDAYGRAKYGMRLTTRNGRDQVEDARQELGDFNIYDTAALLEGRDRAALRRLARLALALAEERNPAKSPGEVPEQRSRRWVRR